MSEISLNTVNGVDIVQYQPQGVCSKLIQMKIKDNIIQDIEIIGGCSGNLKGISVLVKGQNVLEVAQKLQGIPCGTKATSCPDQLSKALLSYIEAKSTVNA